MITFILIEPQNAGNIGAVARSINNFGFDKLILINPRANHLDKEAIVRSCHATHVLKNAKIEKSIDVIKTFDMSIGSTGVMGSDYNILRTPISSKELKPIIKKSSKKNIAIILGREDQGMKNEELDMCDFIVTIPTHKDNPATNLSHAAIILAYEASNGQTIIDHINKPIIREKEILDQTIKNLFDKIDFQTPTKKQTAYKVLKKTILKSSPSKRELMALIGFFKKL